MRLNGKLLATQHKHSYWINIYNEFRMSKYENVKISFWINGFDSEIHRFAKWLYLENVRFHWRTMINKIGVPTVFAENNVSNWSWLCQLCFYTMSELHTVLELLCNWCDVMWCDVRKQLWLICDCAASLPLCWLQSSNNL